MDTVDSNGITALGYAAGLQKDDSARALLAMGADVFALGNVATNRNGQSSVIMDLLTPDLRQEMQREMDRRVAAALSVMPEALPHDQRREIIGTFTRFG